MHSYYVNYICHCANICCRGLMLHDLSIMDECFPDKLDNTTINFKKRKLMSEYIREYLKFQVIPHNFQYVHQIATLLDVQTLYSDKDIRERAKIAESNLERN